MIRLDGVRPAIVLAACVMLCGCGSKPTFERAAVRGTVTIGGQPLASGIVRFAPTLGNGPSVVATVTNGSYSLSAADGPVVGENSVEIDSSPILPGMEIDDEQAYAKMIIAGGGEPPKNPVPVLYRTRSPLRKTIEASKENVHDFPLEAPVETVSPEANY